MYLPFNSTTYLPYSCTSTCECILCENYIKSIQWSRNPKNMMTNLKNNYLPFHMSTGGFYPHACLKLHHGRIVGPCFLIDHRNKAAI